MAMVPETLWPEHPYSLRSNSSDQWLIGICDQENVGAGWYPYFTVPEFREIILRWHYVNNSGTIDNAADNVIFTFPNGVQLVIKIWTTLETTPVEYYEPHWASRLMYDGYTYTQQEATAMGLGNLYNIGDQFSSINFYDDPDPNTGTVKLTMFLVAQYYPSQGTENVTKCKGLQFCLAQPMDPNYNDLYQYFVVFTNQKASVKNVADQAQYSGSPTTFAYLNIHTEDPPPFSIVNLETAEAQADKYGNKSKDPWINETKPDPGDDTSGTGGGGGDYDPTSDPIDFPDVPTGGAITSGLLKAFVMSTGTLQQFQSVLWNTSIFDIQTQFQKLVNEPMQCIVSLHALPFTPVYGSGEHVKLGSFDTEVSGLRITENWHIIDCGTLNIGKYWGSALDYAPYTQCEIFLPFIGVRSLKIEDVVNTPLHIKYYVDILNGSCIAFIKCGVSVLYTFTGNCLEHIPVMSQSSDLLKHNIDAVGAVGVGLATGATAAAVAGAAAGAINSATAKNHVQRSGDVAGSSGMMGTFEPYLILHRPKQSLAQGYNSFKGYPCNITYQLSSLSGYTEVQHVHLTGIDGATDTELKEIERLLKEGVII